MVCHPDNPRGLIGYGGGAGFEAGSSEDVEMLQRILYLYLAGIIMYIGRWNHFVFISCPDLVNVQP
jgi:hypothetical protein